MSKNYKYNKLWQMETWWYAGQNSPCSSKELGYETFLWKFYTQFLFFNYWCVFYTVQFNWFNVSHVQCQSPGVYVTFLSACGFHQVP